MNCASLNYASPNLDWQLFQFSETKLLGFELQMPEVFYTIGLYRELEQTRPCSSSTGLLEADCCSLALQSVIAVQFEDMGRRLSSANGNTNDSFVKKSEVSKKSFLSFPQHYRQLHAAPSLSLLYLASLGFILALLDFLLIFTYSRFLQEWEIWLHRLMKPDPGVMIQLQLNRDSFIGLLVLLVSFFAFLDIWDKFGLLQRALHGTALEEHSKASTGAERSWTSSKWCCLLGTFNTMIPWTTLVASMLLRWDLRCWLPPLKLFMFWELTKERSFPSCFCLYNHIWQDGHAPCSIGQCVTVGPRRFAFSAIALALWNILHPDSRMAWSLLTFHKVLKSWLCACSSKCVKSPIFWWVDNQTL